MIEPLRATLDCCRRGCERAGIQFSATICNEDFIAAAVPMTRQDLFNSHQPRFNAAIVNPPYRKIRGDSTLRLLLRSTGIETSNLYTGFVALISKLLREGGEMVAITPRSFCNGPYFKPFRTDLLQTMSVRRLHLFESRSAVFDRDNVLQENVVFHAVKSPCPPHEVIISSSSGQAGGDVTERKVRYDEVVSPDDPEKFIHFASHADHARARLKMRQLFTSLSQLGLSVSTGRVVDFRVREFLRQTPGGDMAPLIYPCHFNGGFVQWPKNNSRKPNAIVNDKRTRELLLPSGDYVLVKRFTAKEERRRIVTCIYDSEQIRAPWVAFENHLNYFHVKGHGLPMLLAKGLAAFLNSTVADAYFRQFNGHTQVNATDLRSLNYPTQGQLERLGRKIASPGVPQHELDKMLDEELF